MSFRDQKRLMSTVDAGEESRGCGRGNAVMPPYLCVWGYVLDPQWMPETADSTEFYIYYVFSYTYIPMIKFNKYTRHGKR